eukprot:scaffold1377_cov220-Pinguiococcus_pyrenoidosus.AAC.5
MQAQTADSLILRRAFGCNLQSSGYGIRTRAASEVVRMNCFHLCSIVIATIAGAKVPGSVVIVPMKACIVSVPTRRKAGEGIADTTELHELVVAANVSALVAARHDGAMHVLSWQHARGTHFAIRSLHGSS